MKNLIAIFILVLLYSCSKDDRNRYSYAGVWNVVKMEQDYYLNGEIDSSVVNNDIGLWLIEDNSTSSYNDLNFEHTIVPESIKFMAKLNFTNNKKGVCIWYAEKAYETRFSLWKSGLPDLFLNFTILKKTRNKLVLQYVQGDLNNNSFLAYKEVLFLERE